MPTVEELVQTLKNADEASYRRRSAASSLGKLAEKRAIKPLAQALSDDDRYLRGSAAEALGAIGDVRAVKPLAGALADDDSEVRRKAVAALGSIGHASAAPALTRALEDSAFGVRSAAKRALEKCAPAGKPPAQRKSAKKPAPSSGRPGRRAVVDVQALLKEAFAGTNVKRVKRGSRYTLTVPLPRGRTQKVTISFHLKDTAGSHLIAMHTVCAPADPQLYKQALKMNLKIPYGAVGIASVRGKDHFVLTDTQLARTAQPLEIRKSVLTIAQKADAIEEELTGQDVT